MIQKTIKNDFDYFGIFENSRISKNPKIWKNWSRPMSRKKGWKFFWCSKIQFKRIFERNFNFSKIWKNFQFWSLCILTYWVYFGSLLDKTRGQLRSNKNPNSSVLNLNGINVTLSQNLSHVSVSWKASLMQWSSSPSCRAQAQWFNVTCLLLWATGQIEINRLNAKTVLKIMIDNFWILNFKKLLWFSVLTYILRVP